MKVRKTFTNHVAKTPLLQVADEAPPTFALECRV